MRLIDADKVKEDNEVYWDLEFCHPRYEDTLKDVIENAPTVDAIEVVRCKDCKWFGKNHFGCLCYNEKNWCRGNERKSIFNISYIDEEKRMTEEECGNWFCADGEKRQ